MNKFYKIKWLEALRSGEYAQEKGRLCTRGKSYDKFCCLGVICDIVARETNEPWRYVKGGDFNSFRDCTALFSTDLRRKFEISFDQELQLIRKNDFGASFDEIANWIERNL